MIIVRIGNNIHVLWKLYTNTGTPYRLSGKIERLWISSAALEKEITTYELQHRNELTFTIFADELTRYGTYKLVLKVRESESETEDSAYDVTQIFQVVSSSYPDAMNAIDGEVEVEFTSVLNNILPESGDIHIPDDVAYIGNEIGEGETPVLDFNAYTDTVWNKAQTLTDEQKAQVLANLGIETLVKAGDEIIADGGSSTETI